MTPGSLTIPEKCDVLGVGISATSYSQVAEICASWVRQKRSCTVSPARYICATSVHGVMEARKSDEVRTFLNQADISTPDGMPLVWALRSFGIAGQQRVYGPTLMLRVCEEAARLGHRIFLYGGREETLGTLRDNLIRRFPDLQIAGMYSPPFRPLNPEEEQFVRRTITDAAVDILFVGLSTPKQERWMAEHKACFPGVVMFGVGAAFDFHAGRVKQAPPWMQTRGLEWLYRLGSEPGRLWKRYLLVTPWFLPLWAMQKIGLARATRCIEQ